MAVPLPTYIFLLCVFLTIDQRFHASRISAFTFEHIDQVKPVSLVLPGVINFKKVPLSESLCPIVILHEKIILKITHFDCFFEVSRLKPAFKLQSGIQMPGLFEPVVRSQFFKIAV